MRGRARGAALLLAVLCAALRTTAATAAMAFAPAEPADPRFFVRSWRTDEGLPSDAVNAVTQTRDGWIWVATNAGLARFDGVRFTVFDHRNTPALQSDGCGDLREDRDTALWIGTMGGGLTRYRDGRFTPFGREAGLDFEYVGRMFEDAEGRLWIGSSGGLYLRDGERFVKVAGTRGFPADFPQFTAAFAQDEDGWVWFLSSDSRLFSWKAGVLRTREQAPPPVPASVEWPYNLFLLGADDWWTAESLPTRLFHVVAGIAVEIPVAPVSPTDRIRHVRKAADGTVWVGLTESGLRRIRGDRVLAVGPGDGLPSGDITSLLLDHEGSVWAGTPAGLARVTPMLFATIGAAQGLPTDKTWAVFEDSRGDVWFGTEVGAARLHEGRIETLAAAGTIPGLGVVSFTEDRNGAVWIGSTRGLARYEDGKATRFTTADGLTHDNIRALYADREGRVWIGTSAGGLNVYEDGSFRAIRARDGLAADWVRWIEQDREGAIWACTNGGISRIRGGEITSWTVADGLPDPLVLTMHQDPAGDLWFGTYRGGLLRFRDGKFQAVTTAAGLVDDSILRVLEDASGRFWMTTGRGVFRVDRSALTDFLDGRGSSVPSAGYGKRDGLPTPDCSGGTQPAGWRARDGRLWIPTSRGVALLNPADVHANDLPPPVVLEATLLDGAPAGSPGGEIEIPAGTRSLELRYTALSFRAPERVRFRYRLQGYDDGWVDAGTRRSAFYTTLPPGSFQFQVIAANEDGIWNEEGAAAVLRVDPHFYQTIWFYALCALVAGSLIWTAHRFRLRQVRARYAAVLTERGRIARELHDTIAQGFAAVSMQLEAVAGRLPDIPAEARESLDRARLLVRTSLADARRSVRALRPHALESGNLAASLRQVASALTTGTGTTATVEVSGRQRPLPPETEDNLFRVGQEAMTNAIRHGKCRSLRARIAFLRSGTELTVEDDGIGFEGEPPPSAEGGGLGVPGMRERMERLGGRLEITSEPGRGTRVRAFAPARAGDAGGD